jgi:hypothetical protein
MDNEIKKILIRNLNNTINNLKDLKEEADDSLQVHFDEIINYCIMRIDLLTNK